MDLGFQQEPDELRAIRWHFPEEEGLTFDAAATGAARR